VKAVLVGLLIAGAACVSPVVADPAVPAPAPPDVVKPGPAGPGAGLPPLATVKTRMSTKTQLMLYPPTAPPKADAASVLFFSGDWGWVPLAQEMAARMAAEGRYVVGIDSTGYFGRKLDPSDWVVDLKTLRGFLNEKAGRPAGSPVTVVGFTYGAEMVPYVLNRGGVEGIAGTLLIGPDREGTSIYRIAVQLHLPAPPDEGFDVAEEMRRLPPIPVVLIEGALDTYSQARSFLDLLRGPRKYVPIVGADRHFRQTRDTYFTLVSQALAWIEGPHPPGVDMASPTADHSASPVATPQPGLAPPVMPHQVTPPSPPPPSGGAPPPPR
jgi:hypothetical protein